MVANETRQRLSVGLGIAASHEIVAKSSGLAPAGFGLPLARARLPRPPPTSRRAARKRREFRGAVDRRAAGAVEVLGTMCISDRAIECAVHLPSRVGSP